MEAVNLGRRRRLEPDAPVARAVMPDRDVRTPPPVTSLVLCFGMGSVADATCRYPPPVIHCEDWRSDEDGVLIARRTLVVGLLQVEKDHYIGGGISIAGYDYGDLLKRQCAPPRSFWKRWFGAGD